MPPPERPLVTSAIRCRPEVLSIGRCLELLCACAYPKRRLEMVL